MKRVDLLRQIEKNWWVLSSDTVHATTGIRIREAALADVKSAMKFHLETFGPETLEIDPPILEAFITEAGVSV